MYSKVSAVVSVFNAGDFLPHKMDSLLAQTMVKDDRLEIVFVNANINKAIDLI